VTTRRVFPSANSNNFSCSNRSVFGSMLDVASSRQMILCSRNITRKKLMICFSPLDRLLPEFSISNLQSVEVFTKVVKLSL
jgi:hypothetical protein